MVHETGRYIPSTEKFNAEVAGDGCDRFMAATPRQMVGSKRWQKLMDRAEAFNTAFPGRSEDPQKRRLG